MTKANMFVNTVAQQDQAIEIGTLMEHNDPPSLIVQVTNLTGQPGAFTGTDIGTGFHMDDWDYEKFHIFRGEITLSQGY